MSESVLSRLRTLVAGRSAVGRVADDPETVAALMLLARAAFADRHLAEEEKSEFATICERVFDIPKSEMPEVLRAVADIGYETSAAQAAAVLADSPLDMREKVLRTLVEVVCADDAVLPSEVLFLRRVASTMQLDEDRVEAELAAAQGTG